MPTTNFEFKARTNEPGELEKKLLELSPRFVGEDLQTDTYFNVATGRLKLREGNIENSLIYYERENTAGAKQSDILLYEHAPDKTLKELLVRVHGIKVVVQKQRKIYFIDNIKFHFDTVANLGTFVEVEAIDRDGTISIDQLKKQCAAYSTLFNIQPGDYIDVSYSDMMLAKDQG